MTLLVDTDADPRTGWHGYDVLVNRSRTGEVASVERYDGDGQQWRWKPVGGGAIRLTGDALTIAVPRKLLQPSGGGPPRFDFKWTDNLPAEPTVWDFYRHGDVAPDGRFNFRYPAS